jgi:hypothetical protein
MGIFAREDVEHSKSTDWKFLDNYREAIKLEKKLKKEYREKQYQL